MDGSRTDGWMQDGGWMDGWWLDGWMGRINRDTKHVKNMYNALT